MMNRAKEFDMRPAVTGYMTDKENNIVDYAKAQKGMESIRKLSEKLNSRIMTSQNSENAMAFAAINIEGIDSKIDNMHHKLHAKLANTAYNMGLEPERMQYERGQALVSYCNRFMESAVNIMKEYK